MKHTSRSVSIFNAMGRFGVSQLLQMQEAKNAGWEALIGPHFATRIIQTLYHVGFLDALAAGDSADAGEFASTHGLNAPLLAALCDTLYIRGFLRKDETRYSLDSKGRFLMNTDLIRGWFDLAYGYENVLNNLEPLLRGEIEYGKDLKRDGRYVATGSGLISTSFYFPLVTDKVEQGNYRRVLDIGCGDGTFLRYLCGKLPGVEGVGVDLSPEAVAAGEEQLATLGMSGRIRLHAGDAMELEKLNGKLAGVDAAATFFVLHELCDGGENARAVDFLKAFRRALPGVPFYIVEPVRPSAEEMRRKPGPGVEYFLLHDLTRQNPIGREAWLEVFHKAGFASVDEDFVEFARTSIYRVE